MSYKKAPSIKYIEDKKKRAHKEMAHKEYLDRIYAQNPVFQKAISDYVKKQINQDK